MKRPAELEFAPTEFSWRQAFVFSAAIWTVAIAIDVPKDTIAAWLLNRPIGWALIPNSVNWWALFIPLTPPVLALAYRVPFRRRRWWPAVAVHFPAAILFAVTHIFFARATALYLADALTAERLSVHFRHAFSFYFWFDALAYVALVSGYWARDYYRRYVERAIAAAELERLAATARFEALRWQLNPHFLFNALNAVSGLVRGGDSEAGVEMLARISTLLRSTLDDSNVSDVTLARELELVELYAAIERVRFRDRLTVEMRVDDDLLDARVPALILQPLVENAVRHGVSTSSDDVRIDVGAERTADGVRLTVRDNGSGFPHATAMREGVGLTNTRARLAHRYGTAARLELQSPPEGGGMVSLVMPYEPDREAA